MSSYYEHLYLENLDKTIPFEHKIEAIKKLGEFKSNRAIPKLRKLAADTSNSTKLRITSLFSLIMIEDRGFIDEYLPLIEIENEDILEVLILGIKELYLNDYIKQFESFLNYPITRIKEEIIDTLLYFDTKESIDILLKLYNDSDKGIRELIKYKINGSNSFKEYLSRIDDYEALNIITIIPRESAELLVDKMIKKIDNERKMKIIIRAIGELNLKNQFHLLEKMFYKTENQEIKFSIIDTLANLITSEKKEILFKLIDTEKRDMKVKALFALNNLNDHEDVINKFIEIAENSNEWWMCRKISLMNIGSTQNDKYVDAFIKILNQEEDIRVIRTIIQQLGELGSEKVIEYLEKYLDKKNELEIQKVAAVSLANLGSYKALDIILDDTKSIESLDTDTFNTIVKFDDERVSNLVLEVLDKRIERLIPPALENIAVMLIEKSMDYLIEIILDKDVKREHRAKAFMILSNYQDSKVNNLIMQIVEDKNEWWMLKKVALLVIGEQNNIELLDVAILLAKDIDIRISKGAKEVVGKLYKERFIPILENNNVEAIEIGKKFAFFFN